MSDMMKAVVFGEHGDSSVLQFKDMPAPEIAEDEVLVRVKACALNRLDLFVRNGMPGVKIPMPHIGGCDMAGVVEKAGSLVKNVKPGDRIMAAPGVSSFSTREALSGRDNISRDYTLLGYGLDGGFAEFVKMPARNAIPAPENFSFEEAAAVPLVFLTAWHMFVTLVNLRPGETALVHAAGSGVGSAGIQIAKMIGAEVITTAGTDEKLEKAKELGADHVVNYTKDDFAKAVREITNRRGVDVVFEHTGMDTFEGSVKSLAVNGRLVTCGATTGFDAKLDLRFLFAKHLTLYGSYMGGLSELHDLLPFFEKGLLKPVIDRTFPLSETAAAQDYLADRKQFGKIIVLP